ncbi:tRNA lysidine(34) synthetase TilS [Camelliibacillus cellulosilyticus]|uniref:tRNA(Ile)-lysidine synthase n=1 Tax=Camelliibacillus cellulosilyticus TaxID=2174486 RepID=A0ABV9GUK5_9BACL
MESDVDAFVKRHDLIPMGSTIVVGVSGGSDSMALLNYLLGRKEAWDLKLIVCTVNHGLRGAAAESDMAFVADFCRERHLSFEGVTVDVRGYQAQHHVSEETAARACRYHAFEKVMKKVRANLLALAHHGDDQIETMLMRQVRGSFGLSKTGMAYKRPFATGFIIRPFLTLTKEAIETYCHECGIQWRQDPSNFSDQYTRNRFRHEVLPFLKKENPFVHLRFQQDSEVMRDDFLFLDELAGQRLKAILCQKSPDLVKVKIADMLNAPVPLQRRMIHLILNYLYCHAGMSPDHQFIHIENLLIWLRKTHASGEQHLPGGLIARRSYDHCFFSFKNASEPNDYFFKMDLPGEIQLPLGIVQAGIRHTYPKTGQDATRFICDYDQVTLPIYIRTRKPGDRMRPAGMEGTKKIKDLFIDLKIPRDLRSLWPVVTDGEDRVIWLPLLRFSNYAPISEATKNYLVLNFMKKADSGGSM